MRLPWYGTVPVAAAAAAAAAAARYNVRGAPPPAQPPGGPVALDACRLLNAEQAVEKSRLLLCGIPRGDRRDLRTNGDRGDKCMDMRREPKVSNLKMRHHSLRRDVAFTDANDHNSTVLEECPHCLGSGKTSV